MFAQLPLPPLYLAPMEGVGDLFFRKAMAKVGGFKEATTEFLRVPRNAHISSLAKKYNSQELSPIPLAAQVMGQDPALLAAMTEELIKKGAPRIDLNCGCPSNTVVGRGAGSTLLKTPDLLGQIVTAMVIAAKGRIPITVKMRAGYEDCQNLKANLLAAEQAGAAWITLHHRTKTEGYSPARHWHRIKNAKKILSIPLIGSGDITSPASAYQMLMETGCDGLMIGRGAIYNPLIFLEIQSFFQNRHFHRSWKLLFLFLQTYKQELEAAEVREKTQVNKLKQLCNYLFRHYPAEGLEEKKRLLSTKETCSTLFFKKMCASLSYLEKNLSSK